MGHGLQTNSHVLRIVSGFCLPRYHASKNTVTNVQFAQTALTETQDAKERPVEFNRGNLGGTESTTTGTEEQH